MTEPLVSLSIAATAFDLLALVLAFGVVATGLWLHGCRECSERLVPATFTLVTVSSLFLLAVRSTAMAGLPLRDWSEVVGPVLRHTHFGAWWLVRAGAIAVLWLVRPLWTRIEGSRALAYAALAVVAWSRVATGHPGDHGFSLALVDAWVHLQAASVWVGALFVMVLSVFTRRRDGASSRTVIFESLSRLATIAFLTAMATGAPLGVLEIGHWSALRHTTYGRWLSLKLALIAVMAALGAHNHFRKRPRFRWGGVHAHSVWRDARTAITAEALIGLAVLWAVASLGHGMPPTSLPPPSASAAPAQEQMAMSPPVPSPSSSHIVETPP